MLKFIKHYIQKVYLLYISRTSVSHLHKVLLGSTINDCVFKIQRVTAKQNKLIFIKTHCYLPITLQYYDIDRYDS